MPYDTYALSIRLHTIVTNHSVVAHNRKAYTSTDELNRMP